MNAKLARGSASDYLESLGLLVSSIEKLEIVIEGNSNPAPTDIALTNSSVAENSASGTVVGTLSATDPGDTVTFSLLSNAGGRFAISGNSLVVAGSLNFEGGPSHQVTVRVTDSGGKFYDETFTIAVGNVNETPIDIALSGSSSVAENSSAGTVVGALSALDPDAADTATFTLLDNAGGRFAISGNDLVVAGSLNFEGGPSHQVTVRVTDAGGKFYDETFTIAVGNVNETPTDIALSGSSSVAENSSLGTVVGALSSLDPDAADTATFTLVDNAGGRFAISGNNLVVAGSLNFEAGPSHQVTVRVTDSGGKFYDETFTIAVGNVNEMPSGIALTNNTVAENAAGAVVGTLSTVDPDAGATHTYTVSDDRFVVDGNTLKLRNDASFDYETVSSVGVTVTANDGANNFNETFTINVTNANDVPANISLSANAVNENAAGATIGILTATDQDAGDTHTFSIADANSAFEVVDNVLKLKDEVALDFEEIEQLSVTITVTDAAGASFDREFVITVNDATSEGVGADGYIAGAEVFADANENGVRDSGENWTTTDAFGNFSFFGPVVGPLVLSGGTDISTGHEFTGVMRAAAGSTVITPLTTLVMAIVNLDPDNPVDVATAQAQVLAGLGLGSELDLANFDPISAALSSDPNIQLQGSAAIAAAVQIQNTIVQAASLLDGADGNLSLEAAAAAVVTQLAMVLTAGTLDLNTASSLQSIIEDAAEAVGLTDEVAGGLAEGAAAVISSTNAVVEQAILNNETGIELLTILAQVSSVAQGEASAALADVGSGEASVEDLASYADLTDELENAQVGNVTGAVGDGDDVLFGTDNTDTLEGFGGHDTVNGLGGHDILIGGAGNDLLVGGAGRDRANYTAATGAIDVDLAAGTVTGDASIGIDTLREVEIVRGTDFADTFDAAGFGQAGALNVGSDGTFNQFEGRGGDDIIIGSGSTSISYRSATGAVAVDLAAGTAIGDASVGSDDIQGGVTNVSGSAYNDNLLGNGGSNTLVGNAGNDFINGRGGNDRAVYSNVVEETVTGGVTINMAAGTVIGDASVGSDTLRSIEFIRGSKFDDAYDATGFGLAGALNIGNGGTFNEIEGMGGNDTIIANGNTRIAFYNATGAVTVDLELGTATGDGSVGTDTITGTGVIQVAGSQFGDTFYGRTTTGQAAENFEGRAGNDFIDGRGGFDRALYNMDGAVSTGITVDLAAGIVTGDDAVGTDTLRSVEGVRGTNFADTFVATGFGTSSTNAGTNDFNEFDGQGGNDTITGNNNTRLIYSSATSGVVVNFSTGTVTGDSSVGTDTFTGVFSVQGSNFNDTYVYGSGAGNYLITNFIVGAGSHDKIDLTGVAGVYTLDDVLTFTSQAGAHTVINFGPGNAITLNNVALGNLHADDFIFAPNPAPTDIALSGTTIAENSANGTVVGSLSATDPNDTAAFSLVDDAGGRFAIVGTDLVLVGALNFENAASYQVTVRVTDSGGSVFNETFTIDVTDVNEAPTAVAFANTLTAVDEYVTVPVGGIKVADVVVTDDALGTETLTLSGPDAGSFTISGGALYYTGASPDFATQSSYSVTVNAADTSLGAPAVSQTFVLTINDVTGITVIAPLDTNSNTLTGTSEGNDTVDYSATTLGVDINLAMGTASGPEIGSDIVTGFENAIGGSGNDTLRGHFGDNQLFGGDGDDLMTAGTGTDLFDGGNGLDRVTYQGSATALTINLAAGTGVVGVFNKTFLSTELIRGTNQNDTFDATGFSAGSTNAGSAGTFNEFEGLGGADTITGNGNTRISYASASGGVVVDFSTHTVTGNASVGVDAFTGVNSVEGSNFDDTYVFSSGAGDYSITNFVAGPGGVDKIDLSSVPGMWDLAHVLAVATQDGDDTVLDFGNGDVLTLSNVTLGNLEAGDFVFTPNQAPTVTLANVIASLPENTATPVKIADIVVSDDGFGTNTLSLAGLHAASFEIVVTGLISKPA